MSRPAAGIPTGQRFMRTYALQHGGKIDLRKTYIRDTVILDDTGAIVTTVVRLPKIGTAYAPVGLRSTFKKSSNVQFAISFEPFAGLDGISAPSAPFPSMGGPGVPNASLLPLGTPNSVTLEATDMALTGSVQPNPTGGTPTTEGAWLTVQGGGASTGVVIVTSVGSGVIGGTGASVPIVPGPAITASTKIMVTRTVAPGSGHAYGLLTYTKTPGAAGVGIFIVSAISETTGALVPADASTFDYVVFEPVA